MTANYGIDEALCRKVKLERFYEYSERYNLNWNGKQISGCHSKGKIYLDAELGRHAVAVYLHEVAHAIALGSGLDTSPDAAAHNQYFAVLVAVMYRRAKMLHYLKIYDFCDTEDGQTAHLKNAPVLTAPELTRRFRYIMRRSAQLAKTNMTIEEVGRLVFQEDAWPHWSSGEPTAAAAEQHSRVIDMLVGAISGSLLTVATVAAATNFF